VRGKGKQKFMFFTSIIFFSLVKVNTLRKRVNEKNESFGAHHEVKEHFGRVELNK